METMFNQSMYICRALTAKETKLEAKRNHNKAMSEVRPTVQCLFGEIKAYKFVHFTSKLKTGLSFVERNYLVHGILENAKTCLYGNKADDVFEATPITVTFCYPPEIKAYGT